MKLRPSLRIIYSANRRSYDSVNSLVTEKFVSFAKQNFYCVNRNFVRPFPRQCLLYTLLWRRIKRDHVRLRHFLFVPVNRSRYARRGTVVLWQWFIDGVRGKQNKKMVIVIFQLLGTQRTRWRLTERNKTDRSGRVPGKYWYLSAFFIT